jgi:hypothetical protein
MSEDRKLEEARRLLEQAGYEVVRRKAPRKRHTFNLRTDLLQEFFEVQERERLGVSDAIEEAIEDWIKSKGKK